MRRAFQGHWFTLALLAACVLLVTGQAFAQETVRLTFWTFVDAHADYFLARAREFDEMRPDINFQLEAVSMPYQEMHDQLLIALQTGIGGPDIVDIEITPFHRYLRDPIHLHDVSRIIDPHRNGIIEARLTPYQKDGRQYGVPTHLGAFVTYYNTELLGEAGIDVNAIQLWSDYVEAGKKITRDVNGDGRIDRWMTMLDGGGWFQWFGMIQQLGSGEFDQDGNVILDAPANIEALKFLHELVYGHQIALVGTGLHDAVAYEMINAGEIASVWMPQWYMIRYTEFMPDLHGKIAIRPLPAWEPGGRRSAMGGGTGTAITDQINPNHLQIAMEFLEYTKLTYEANVRIWTEFGFDPFRHDVFSDPRLREPLPYFSNEIVFDVILDVYDELAPQYLSPIFQETNWDILDPEVFFPVMRENIADPETALKNAAQRARELLESMFW